MITNLAKFFAALILLTVHSAQAANWMAGRDYLSRLSSRGRMDWADYQGDFMISQSAALISANAVEVRRRLETQFQKTQLSIRGTYGKNGTPVKQITISNLAIPDLIFDSVQLNGLKKCVPNQCIVKLNNKTEISLLREAKDKKSAYQTVILNRLKLYLSERKLLGYEDRQDQSAFLSRALATQKFLPLLYPKAHQFLLSWLGAGASTGLTPFASLIRGELVQISSDKTQPVYRLVEDLQFNEGGAYLAFEVHIYTNHYFDSSFRIFEIFPYPENTKQTVYIVTDVLEVDELKKSAIIRSLLKAPMEDAVMKLRQAEMKEVSQ